MDPSSRPDTRRTGPLAGVTVLDFTRILAGPFCTMTLGDLGADVIKVERPSTGDDTRRWGPPFCGAQSAYFLAVNRNKRSLTLDLRSERGRELARALVDRADVIVHNFRPGVADDLGVDYASVSQRNPRVVYCTVSGFGLTGPDARRAGYDALVQGMGGLMSITGAPEGAPTKVGVAITDVVTGLYGLCGVLAALYGRERSGRGDHVDVSLLDSAVAVLVNQAQSYLVTGDNPRRLGNAHPSIAPYETFFAEDGPFIVAVGNDAQFARLAAIVGRPELAADPRFRSNAARVAHRDQLAQILNELFAGAPKQAWFERCAAQSVPCGPINRMSDLFAEPQVKARKMKVSVEHPTLGALDLVGSPLKLWQSCGDEIPRRAPPLLGEHTAEILDELGHSAEEIAALRAAKVV